MLEGLDRQATHAGKGFVTVDDIKNYTLAQLRRWRIEHGDAVQEPNARVESLGDMILVDWRQLGE